MGGLTLGQITAEVREVNIALGWRSPDGGICEGQTYGDYIALLHTEVAEALEAYRDHRLADATDDRYSPITESGDPPLPKPEGVGSEFADVLIRLVDMADAWDLPLGVMDATLAEVEPFRDMEYRELATFGDWMAWMHFRIVEMELSRTYDTPLMLRALVTTARYFGIDLDAEYRRKIAYNRTRDYQHGGRTLAGEK